MLKRRTPMPRVAFKRKPPVRVTLPVDDDFVVTIERIAPRLYRVPAPSAPRPLVAVPKAEILRSESYRRFVASFPCFECGAPPPSQCAHANEGKGMGMKVCDRRSFPLCFPCHAAFDQSRGMTREQRRAKEVLYVDRMQAIARAAGRSEIPP